MKKLNLLVAATVLASMTGSLVAGAANVSPTKLDTKGHVKFHAGNGGENGAAKAKNQHLQAVAVVKVKTKNLKLLFQTQVEKLLKLQVH